MNDNNDMLAIYGAPFKCQDVQIAGTRAALERLRLQIDVALRYGKLDSRCHMHVDGEGFDVIVRLLPPDSMAMMPPHYTDPDIARWTDDDRAKITATFYPEKNNGPR